MKKLLFGFAFSIALSISSFNLQAQTNPEDPGFEGGGDKWICCQVTTNQSCTDMTGSGHYGTVKKVKC